MLRRVFSATLSDHINAHIHSLEFKGSGELWRYKNRDFGMSETCTRPGFLKFCLMNKSTKYKLDSPYIQVRSPSVGKL